MGLIDQARLDIQRITSDLSGFGQQIIMVSPTDVVAAIVGLHRKINLAYDTEGNIINSRQSYISVSEAILVAAAYPIRNGRGEVDLKNHKVYVRDSSGRVCSYKVNSWTPDETIGLIPMFLEDYTPSDADFNIDFSAYDFLT